MPETLLLVGPSKELRRLARSCLADPPFKLELLAEPLEAVAYVRENSPAAVILWANGGVDELLNACEQIRATGPVPLIVASKDGSSEAAVKVLEAGADDYVSTDISPRELRARVRAHLRRHSLVAEAFSPIVRIGELEIDRDHQEARYDGRSLTLAPKEFALLEYLGKNMGRVVRRQEVLREVWGYPEGLNSRTLDVHVSRLRRKLTQLGAPLRLETVPGVGYKLIEG